MSYAFENAFKGTDDFPASIFGQKEYVAESHHHFEYEILYISEGDAKITIGDNLYDAKKGDCFFIYPGIDHQLTNQNYNFHYYAIFFDKSIIGMNSEATNKQFSQIVIRNAISISPLIIDEIIKTTVFWTQENFGREIALKKLIFDILLDIIRSNQYAPLPSFEFDNQGKKTITNALSYIAEHYQENITLEDLLKVTNYSKSHFIRLFKTTTNMNYTDYLNRFRVKKACRELIYTNKNITEIATENGFNNIQYFSKIFKKYMECSPKQYQKRWHISQTER